MDATSETGPFDFLGCSAALLNWLDADGPRVAVYEDGTFASGPLCLQTRQTLGWNMSYCLQLVDPAAGLNLSDPKTWPTLAHRVSRCVESGGNLTYAQYKRHGDYGRHYFTKDMRQEIRFFHGRFEKMEKLVLSLIGMTDLCAPINLSDCSKQAEALDKAGREVFRALEGEGLFSRMTLYHSPGVTVQVHGTLLTPILSSTLNQMWQCVRVISRRYLDEIGQAQSCALRIDTLVRQPDARRLFAQLTHLPVSEWDAGSQSALRTLNDKYIEILQRYPQFDVAGCHASFWATLKLLLLRRNCAMQQSTSPVRGHREVSLPETLDEWLIVNALEAGLREELLTRMERSPQSMMNSRCFSLMQQHYAQDLRRFSNLGQKALGTEDFVRLCSGFPQLESLCLQEIPYARGKNAVLELVQLGELRELIIIDGSGIDISDSLSILEKMPNLLRFSCQKLSNREQNSAATWAAAHPMHDVYHLINQNSQLLVVFRRIAEK